MTDESPTHVDLFSGIGGFALAAQWAGFRTIAFCEIDSFCNRVLRKHWPDVPNYGDVRRKWEDMQCNILTGGFPCQPFSIAGLRKGTDDNRNLWPSMLDAISTIKPDWVIGENVTNIANMVLSDCLDDLEGIGYFCKVFDIPACAVGLPTMERHVWIIATANGEGLQGGFKKTLQNFPLFQGELRGSNSGVGAGRNLPEHRVCRSNERVPYRMDRLKGLGNAIVPQVAYEILKEIRNLI